MSQKKINICIEQEVKKSFKKLLSEQEEITGQQQILTPNGKIMYIPSGSKILSINYDNNILNFPGLKNWLSSSKGGSGNEYTNEWVPKDTSKFQEIESVNSFQTSDGKKFKATFTNQTLDRLNFKTWDEFNSYTEDKGGKPDDWVFKGYFQDNGEAFKSTLPEKTWWQAALDHILKYWDVYLEVIVSLVAGILTAGTSLLIQVLVQGVVALLFSVDDIIKGDGWAVGLSVAIASVPIVGRLAKYGTKAPINFLKKYGKDLARLRDPVVFSNFFNSLKEGEKLLLTRALRQTPGEMKKHAGEYLKKLMDTGVKEGKIVLSKIPWIERLAWKQFFVEGGVQIGVGVGITVAQFFSELGDMEEKLSQMVANPEKAQEYTSNMEEYAKKMEEAEKENEENW